MQQERQHYTGKTTLYNFIKGAEDNIVGYEYDIPISFHAVDKRELSLNEYHQILLVIDEDAKILHQDKAANILKDSDNYFLIISRKVPQYLPLGVKNLIRLEVDYA